MGIGVVAYNAQPTLKISTQWLVNIGPNQLVYNGELEGVTLGLEYLSRTAKQGYSYKVYSDNQAGLYRLKTPSDDPGQQCQLRTIQATKIIREKGANIALE